MRINIKQCRYCPEKDCEHAFQIRKAVKGINLNLVVSHNCMEYPKLFKAGEQVKIKMYNQVVEEREDEYGEVIGLPEWQEIGEFKGIVEGKRKPITNEQTYNFSHGELIPDKAIIIGKKFFLVKLDVPVRVQRWDKEAHKKIEVEIEYIKKTADKIWRKTQEAK